MVVVDEVEDSAEGPAASPEAAPVEAQEPGGAEGSGPAGDGEDKYGLNKGKDEFNKGNYEEAVKSWTRSMQSVNYILNQGLYKNRPDQLKEVHDMEAKICVNLAMGCIKTGDYNKAIENADKALARDSTNSKALYRKASALKLLLSFSEAAAVLERLLQVEPESAAAKQMLAEVQRDAQRSERKEKKMSQKMFASLAADRDPRVPPTARQALLEFLRAAPAEARAFAWECLEQCWGLPRRLLEAARSLLASFGLRLPLGAASADVSQDRKQD